MPGIPVTSKAVEAAVATDKAAKLIPTGKQLLGGGARFGGTISTPAAIGAAAILGISEGLFPRRTVTEADEQRAIRQAEATRQWRKEQRDKANQNPNLDYLAGESQVIEAEEPPFTGGQESGVNYTLHVSWTEYNRSGTPFQASGAVTGVFGPIPREPEFSHQPNDFLRVTVWAGGDTETPYVENQIISGSTSWTPDLSTIQYEIVRADGQPDNTGGPSPFYGGQDENKTYSVTATALRQRTLSPENFDPYSVGIGSPLPGKITKVFISGGRGNLQATPPSSLGYFTVCWSNSSISNNCAIYPHEVYKGGSVTDVKIYEWGSSQLDTEGGPPNDNTITSESNPGFPGIQPIPGNNLTEITASTPKELAQKLAGLIREGRLEDSFTTPEVRDELRKIIAASNAISNKTNVVDNLDNSDGYATAYSDGYSDGFAASLERDRLNTQNKANNLDVAIPKPAPVAKQKPTAVTATVGTVTQEKAKEPNTTTKTYLAGSTPIKETTVTDSNTGIKTITKANAETGKVVSIKRTIPAGVTVTNTGVSNDPIKAKNAVTTTVGTPSNTGTGVTPIPQVPTVEQTPTTPQIAGGALTTAAIAAAVYSESGIEKLTSAAAAGTCQTTQPGGCMQQNVVDPLKADLGTIFNKIANTGLAAQNAAIQAIVQNTNDIVKHSTYGLEAIQNAASKAWEATHMDKVINVANLLVATHNAAMLSRHLGETIAEFGTSVLQVFGIKNPVTGEAIDVGEVVGNTIQTAINSIVPEAIRTNVSTTWIKLNRIHSAAVAMASAITATKNAVLEANEVIGDWVAKIGNTQQEQGIVEEDSYPWMKEGVQFKNPYDGFLNKLNNAEEVIEQTSSFVNAAIELKDSVEQVTTSKEELTNALNEFNTTKEADETAKEIESASPEVDRLDLIQLEPDEI